MVVRLKLEELRRGLKVVLVTSLCMLVGLVACFALVSQLILILLPDMRGLGVVVAVGLFFVYVALYLLHVIVDSALALRDPRYFAERGLEACG